MKAHLIPSLTLASAVLAVALSIAPGIASADATTTTGVTVQAIEKQVGPQFLENLSLGSSGADVLRLQRYLNTHGCPLANTGPGSYGMETSYFGSLTKSALVQFQKDTGLITPTGNLGSLTREYISTLP